MEELPLLSTLRGVVTIRKGLIEERPRGGPTRPITFIPTEGFGVLYAKVMAVLAEPEFTALTLADERLYFRKTKGASQMQFECLSNENFLNQIRHRWRRISHGDRAQWGGDVVGNFEFEFFVYCSRPTAALPTIHRATASRIRVADEAVRLYERSSGATLGPITRQHVVTTHARQQDGTPVAVPSDPTTQQAIALDAAMTTSTTEATTSHPTIRLEINGAWVSYKVDVESLRAALGLPQHDIFTRGIYHGFEPIPPPAQDMRDVDHEDDDAMDEGQ